ncbi:hypothetical protein PENTCL1PPCAC_13004, partial [Pristionchus entomophagus]
TVQLSGSAPFISPPLSSREDSCPSRARKMKIAYILTSLFALAAATTEIFYYADGDTDHSIIKCVLDAINRLEETSTCVSFTENSLEKDIAFVIVHSSECAWQPSNRSVHLSADCISDNLCTELIGKAVGVDRPAQDVAHFMGEKFNCTGPCGGLRCEHGGRLMEGNCQCSCVYGFDGQRCENLMRTQHFNDASCGVIEAQDAGSLSLSTYPGDQAKGTFCQWLLKSNDPWAKIELSFDGLDMDGKDMPPGIICNDILSVHGAGSMTKTIPCNGSPVPKLTSTSNWVLVELRTNPWAMEAHAGPAIRYNLITRPTGALAFSEGMTASTVGRSLLPAVAMLLARLL